MFRIFTLLCVLLAVSIAVLAKDEVELSQEQIEVCDILAEKAMDIQKWRRENPKKPIIEYKRLLDPEDRDVLVWYTLADKVAEIPLQMPPMAIGIDLNSHCIVTMQETNKLRYKL